MLLIKRFASKNFASKNIVLKFCGDLHFNYIFIQIVLCLMILMVMVTQHVSNNVDACTHCAYLFLCLFVAEIYRFTIIYYEFQFPFRLKPVFH